MFRRRTLLQGLAFIAVVIAAPGILNGAPPDQEAVLERARAGKEHPPGSSFLFAGWEMGPWENGVKAAFGDGDYARLYGLIEPKVRSGDPQAVFMQGVILSEGLGVAPDPMRSKVSMQQAVDAEIWPATFFLGRDSRLAGDFDTAIKWWSRGYKGYAQNSGQKYGHAEVSYLLGAMKHQGNVITDFPGIEAKDFWNEAFDDWTKRADGGDAWAQHHLAHMYWNGTAPEEQNIDKAIKYFELAAPAFPPARYSLGKLMEDPCWPKDRELRVWIDQESISDAKGLYNSAAKARYPKAYYDVARFQRNEQAWGDYIASLKWGAGVGDPRAQVALAEAYWYGEHQDFLPRDRLEGFIWISIAARAGDGEAILLSNKWATQVDTTTLDIAQLASENWRRIIVGFPMRTLHAPLDRLLPAIQVGQRTCN